jgi:hypothetical protein
MAKLFEIKKNEALKAQLIEKAKGFMAQHSMAGWDQDFHANFLLSRIVGWAIASGLPADKLPDFKARAQQELACQGFGLAGNASQCMKAILGKEEIAKAKEEKIEETAAEIMAFYGLAPEPAPDKK